MTKSKLMERFGRLGPARGIDLVPYGSPEVVALSLAGDLSRTKVIEAVFALCRCGASMLRAKRALEAATEGKTAALEVPRVDDLHRLAAELRGYGFALAAIARQPVEVRALRDRLGLTQEQFALNYGLELDAVRNWEHGRREPDRAAKSYLAAIDREPERVREFLAIPVL